MTIVAAERFNFLDKKKNRRSLDFHGGKSWQVLYSLLFLVLSDDCLELSCKLMIIIMKDTNVTPRASVKRFFKVKISDTRLASGEAIDIVMQLNRLWF